jgi:probable phosphoglycerate mutase
MKRIGREAIILPWLTEFSHSTPLKPDYPDSAGVPWDWRPIHWTQRDEFYDIDRWAHAPEMEGAEIASHHESVCRHFDEFLGERGYSRSGRMYRTEAGNSDTYVLFSHFGIICIMLGHLFGLSPMVLWHSLCALPSSITTVVSEERQKGYVSMRMLSFGATPHLERAGIEPSFAARFCETYEMSDQRH